MADAEDRPVADAWVAVGDPETLTYLHFRSDGDGIVELPPRLPPGTSRLLVLQSGFARVRERIDPRDLPGRTIRLVRARTVTGTVVEAGPPERPIRERARVRVDVAGGALRLETWTGPDGRFEVEDVVFGPAKVTVIVGDGRTGRGSLLAGESPVGDDGTVVVRLTPLW